MRPVPGEEERIAVRALDVDEAAPRGILGFEQRVETPVHEFRSVVFVARVVEIRCDELVRDHQIFLSQFAPVEETVQGVDGMKDRGLERRLSLGVQPLHDPIQQAVDDRREVLVRLPRGFGLSGGEWLRGLNHQAPSLLMPSAAKARERARARGS